MTEPVWYNFARGKLGIKETPGEASNSQILGWARHVGVSGYYRKDSIPWCGLFVGYCMKSSGFNVHSTLLSARSWANFGRALDRPTVGAIMVFTRKGGGHVAFYVSETATHYHVLGGNQRDQVCVTSYPKSRLLAIRWPTGTAAPVNSNVEREVDDEDQGDDFGSVISRRNGTIGGTVTSVNATAPVVEGDDGGGGGGGSGNPVARVGDRCTHNAVIIQGSPTMMVDGKAVARVGDQVNCPQHGMTTIVSPASIHKVDGQSIAHVGSLTGCGAQVTEGSPTMKVP
jgi:uncharacterized protein (TIGR02594 family)